MSTDIATLGIVIDCEGVAKANTQLDTLSRSASSCQRATETLSARFDKLGVESLASSRNAGYLASRLSDVSRTATNSAISVGELSNKLSIVQDLFSSTTGKVTALIAALTSLTAVSKSIDLAHRGVQFNTSIEQSVIGIGTLITSMSKLTDAQGNLLEKQEKYVAAQSLARDMMREIQILGLETTATTQSLVQGVQSVMSSALTAGFSLKQIPQFAVAAAQAMQTIGIPLQQMNTELDALLSGRINGSDDILAPKLFADIKAKGKDIGEYIRQLQSSGKLYDELMKRLEAYKIAGEDVANTLTGLWSNLDEGLDAVSGQVTNNLTSSIKVAAKSLQDLLFTSTDGSIKLSDSITNIADVLDQIYTIAGEKLVSGVNTLKSSVISVNSALEGVDVRSLLSGVETVVKSVTAGYIAMRIAIASTSSTSIAAHAKQIGLVGALSYQIGALQLRIAAVGKSLLAAFGGPVGVAVMALGTAIGYVASTETSAAQVASRHAKELDAVRESTATASKAMDDYAKSLRSMTDEQASIELGRLKQEFDNIVNGRWFESNIAGRVASSLRSWFPSQEEVDELKSITEKLLPSNLADSTVSQLKTIREELAKFAIEKGKAFEFSESGGAGQLLDTLIVLASKIEAAKDRIEDVGEAAATSAPLVTELESAMALLSNTQTATVTTLDGAIKYLQTYTKATEGAKQAAQQNAQAQASQALATLQAGIASAEAAGKMEEATKLRQSYENYQKWVVQANKDASSKSSKRGLDQITRTEESLRKLRQEVQNLREAEVLGAQGYSALVLSIKQGKNAAIADAEAQYKLTLERKSATKEQATQILALQKEKAELEAASKLRDADREKLRTTVDVYTQLAEKTGDWSKATEAQQEYIHQQTSDIKSAIPELSDYADELERLKMEDVSTDALDGARRGLRRFTAEFGDEASQWEHITSSWAYDFNDATHDMFENFILQGELSFESLRRSFESLLVDMAYQALVQPIVVSVVGGVQQSLYGTSTTGTGTGGIGFGNLTSLPVSSLLPESFTSGISGITGTVLPGTRVAGLMGPTASGAALPGGLTIGSALGYGAFGGLGYSLLGGALGLPQNSYTGVTSSLGGALGAWGGAALGSTGALAGSIIGSALPVVGTALGALAGGLIGGLFGGGGDKDPWVNVTTQLDLLGQITNRDPWTDRAYRVEGQGWESTSNQGEGITYETGKQLADMAAELAKQALKDVATFQESVAAIGNSALEEQFNSALEQNRFLSFRYEWEDREIKPEEMTEAFNQAIQEKLYLSLSAVDVTSLTTAADGALADTMPEVTKAITDAMSFMALGANLGEYQDDFNAAISGKLLEALNQMDTSGIALDIDKSSLAGWQDAAEALHGWQEVTNALDEILDPTSELESSLQAATTQFDGWIDRLKDLGWQESAIAEIESRRAQYMNEYASALKRASEQDLNLRTMSLQHGSDSLKYGLQSLKYKQQNELAELAKKFGKDSSIYNQAVEIQQAELLSYQINYYQQQLQEQITGQKQLVDALDTLVQALEDARNDLWTSSQNMMGTRYEEALSQFNSVYEKAIQGDQDALSQLPTLGDNLLSLGKENLATSQEYNDLFYDVDKKLKVAQEYASDQVDAAQSQLDALSAMLEQGDEQQLTLEEISAKLSELMERYQQELADITGGGSLSQREALIQAKVDQLNAIAQGGRTDWTAESFLSYMYGEGLTLQSWYDRFGRYENLGVNYDSSAAYRAILENKADLMNAGLTLAPGQTAGNWTAEKVLAQIKKDGMTVDEWYLRFGLQEGVGEYYKKYSQDAADSTNKTLWDTNRMLSGYLSGINSSINGLDLNVAVNVSGGGSYGGNSTSNTTSSDTVSSNNTTVSGTVSGGWSRILQEKADALNRGETLASGQTAGGWTADKVLEAIHDEGMTVQEWYDRHGKIEGFASGGITPANRPFWVGEDGPELMMSPNQYGVLSNRTSMSLLNQPIDSDNIVTAIRNSGRDIYVVLRQLLTKTDAIYGQQRRILQRLDMWDAEGLPS